MSRAGGNLDVDRVRDATDIVSLIGEHVRLEKKGREHVGICPFHEDRSPSMHVVSHKGPGFYKCFACGASGDCFTFVQEFHRVGFAEALQMLADRAGIPLTPRGGRRGAPAESGPGRGDMLEACSFAHRLYRAVLAHPHHGTTGREVIQRRGISEEMVERFGLGFAPPGFDTLRRRIEADGRSVQAALAAGLLKRGRSGGTYDAFRNRLMFPICDEMGRTIAFGARAIDPEDTPKYLNSSDSRVFDKSRTLYGLHLARPAIVEAGAVIVTEGYTDVIACHQAGVANVVGTMGTALTDAHADRLSRHTDTVILLFDGDEAGQRAADRAVGVFFRGRVDVKVCVLPDGTDPDELLGSEGVDGFRTRLAAAEDALTWKLGRFRSRLDPAAGISARQSALEEFLSELADLGSAEMPALRRRFVLEQLQHLLHVPAEEPAGRLETLERDAAGRRRRGPVPAPAPAAPGPSVVARPATPTPASDVPCDEEGRPLVAPGDVDAEIELEPETPWAPAGPTRPAPPAADRGARGPLDRARRAAEREFAALCLEDPAALRSVAAAVDAEESWRGRLAALAGTAAEGAGSGGTLAATLAGEEDGPGPDLFTDAASRAVASALGRWLAMPADTEPPGAGAIMDTVADEAARGVVATLHFDGEKLAAAAPEPGVPAILAALEALVGMLERRRSEAAGRQARLEAASGSMSPGDLAALVEARRQAGPRPAAIARRPPELTARRSGRGPARGPAPPRGPG